MTVDDMRLLGMWSQAKALEDQGSGLPDDEAERLFRTATELQELIINTPAATVLGIAIKLRIAVKCDGFDRDVVERPQLIVPRAVVNALADAERLAGNVL